MPREYTLSVRYPSGATEALTVEARSEQEAREKIAKAYPGTTITWIL